MNSLKGTKYQHYKTKNFYEVEGLATHSETLQELIIYRCLTPEETAGNNPLWARPKEMFFEMVAYEGEMVPRFKLIKVAD